jgi:urea ABC transporter ATP-binding protein UrtE
VLTAEDVGAGYGSTPVLQELELHVEQGERLALLGRNGVGKTTLLRALIGEIPLTSGRILLDGKDISRVPAYERARRGLAYVPQGRQIFPALSVLDNLRVAAYGTGQRDGKQALEAILDEFPVLREKGHLPGAGLSGGQQQILALGRALMTRPSVLLLDEPSEGIQPSIVDQIATHVRRINGEQGITVLIVEQNLEFAINVAQGAAVMEKGRVVRSLPAADVLSDRELQQEYLGV